MAAAAAAAAVVVVMAEVAMSSGLMMVINAARNGFFYGVKVRWKNGQAGRRGVVAIAGSQADREGQGGKLPAFHSVRWTGGPPVQPLH